MARQEEQQEQPLTVSTDEKKEELKQSAHKIITFSIHLCGTGRQANEFMQCFCMILCTFFPFSFNFSRQ